MVFDRTNIEAAYGQTLLPLARRWRAAADSTLAALGLSNASGWVLLHVGRLGDGVRQGDLAIAADMRGSSLVRLIDRLEADRLIARRVEAGDRRINRIDLTPAGIAIVEQIERALRAVRHDIFAGIEDEDLAIAAAVLQRLDRNVIDLLRQPK